MTDGNFLAKPATDERYRGDLDESVAVVVRGPLAIDNKGVKPIAYKRCLREVWEGVVVKCYPPAAPHLTAINWNGLCFMICIFISEIAQCPALDAEGRFADDLDVCVVELDSKRLVHVVFEVLHSSQAPPQ